MNRNTLTLTLALGLATLLPTSLCWAQPDTQPPAAARAKALFHEGKVQESLALYREVNKLAGGRTSWDVAANHGNTAFQLGLFAEAAERFRYALHAVPTSVENSQLYRDKIQGRLDESMAHIGTVTVVVAPAGAEVLFDGVSHGRAPLAEPVFVTPGSREVQARLAGFKTQAQSINVLAGKASTVTLTLVSAAATAPPPPVKPPMEDEGMSGAQLGVGATALAIGGLGAIATIVFAATAASAGSDADAARAEVEAANVGGGANPCGAGTLQRFPCAALSDAADSQASAGTTAVVLGVVSGTLLLTGIVTLSLGGDDDSDVALSATPGGLLLTGTF